MPSQEEQFQSMYEQYLENIRAQEILHRQTYAGIPIQWLSSSGQPSMMPEPLVIDDTPEFRGLSGRYEQVISDWRWAYREAGIDISDIHVKISSISHKPKGGGKARYILPKGITHEHTGESFPEFLIIERGEGYIPREKWDAAGIAKNRKLKFELSEILDGVYVYKLDKF